jgi:hypothetical protein
MKVAHENSLKYRMMKHIESLPFTAILRSDVSSMSDPRQVSYALSALVKEKKLAHLGYGVYAKMEVINLSFIKTSVLKEDFSTTTREVLNRLHIDWEPSDAENKYNRGESTQVPVRFLTKIKGTFNRKLSYKSMEFEYECISNNSKYSVTYKDHH